MATQEKDILSIRIDGELFAVVEDFTDFLNEELLAKKITKTLLMENLFIRGIKYYFDIAEKYCNDANIARLNAIKDRLTAYINNPWREENKLNKTIKFDSIYHNLMKSYVAFENILYCRELTVNGLLCGTVIHGIDFYIKLDTMYMNAMKVVIPDYDYNWIIEEIRLVERKQDFQLKFKE